jgi:hypothetical protein
LINFNIIIFLFIILFFLFCLGYWKNLRWKINLLDRKWKQKILFRELIWYFCFLWCGVWEGLLILKVEMFFTNISEILWESLRNVKLKRINLLNWIKELLYQMEDNNLRFTIILFFQVTMNSDGLNGKTIYRVTNQKYQKISHTLK